MDVYSTEEQQVEAIKGFWKEYGVSIIGGAVIGLGGLFGWNYYSEAQTAKAEAASNVLGEALVQLDDEKQLTALAEKIDKEYSQVNYSALMQLLVAKAAVEANDLDKAEKSLKMAIANKPAESIAAIATVRLARVQAEQGQVATALTTLEQVKAASFVATKEELKGDLFVQQGDTDKARTAYQTAVENGGLELSSVLQMKLDNLNQA